MFKKASLQLSINAIVIIVLAMTLLGLGLGFISKQFSGFEDITLSVQEQIKQKILEDLRTGNKKFSFPTTEVTINKKESEVIAMGVKNIGSKKMNFVIQIVPKKTEVDDINFRYDNETFVGLADTDPYPFFLEPTEAEVYATKINVGSQVGTNTYSVKVLAYTLDSSVAGNCGDSPGATVPQTGSNPNEKWCPEGQYAAKTFFLTVQ